MKLCLSKSTTIKDLNSVFSNEFPYLKFRFYENDGDVPLRSYRARKISDDRNLGAIAHLDECILEVLPHHTVAETEQRLRNYLDLPVQVLRRMGETWIETTQTDHLTLQKQNAIGREASRPIRMNFYTLFL